MLLIRAQAANHQRDLCLTFCLLICPYRYSSVEVIGNGLKIVAAGDPALALNNFKKMKS
jgi:hypothetical protein